MANNVEDGWRLLDNAQDARVAGHIAQAHTLLDMSARWFVEAGESLGVAYVAQQRATLLLTVGHLKEAEAALDEAERAFGVAGDTQGLGHVSHSRGDLARRKGDIDTALRAYSAAHDSYSRSQDQVGLGNAARSIAEVLLQLGDASGAEPFADQAIASHTDAGHISGVAAANAVRASVARRLKDPAAAQFLEQAMTMTVAVGDENGVALLLVSLAEIALDAGDLESARHHYDGAVAGFRVLGDLCQMAAILLAAANLELNAEDLPAASALLLEAEEAAIAGGAQALLWRFANTRAAVHLAAGELAESVANHHVAVRLAAQDPDPKALARALAELGIAEETAGQSMEAARSMTRSARASLHAGSHQLAAARYRYAGGILRKAGPPDSAIGPLSSAAALFAALGAQTQAASALYELAEIAMDATRWNECLDLFDEVLVCAERGGDSELMGMARMGVADVRRWTGDIPGAMQAVEEAYDYFAAADKQVNMATATRQLAELQMIVADYEQAEALCREALTAYLELGELTGAGNARATLADIAKMRGDSRAQFEHLDAARDHFLQSGDLQGLASTTHALASLVHGTEDDDLFDHFEGEANRLFRDLGDRIGQANVQRSIGERYALRDRERSHAALSTALGLFEDMGNSLGIAHSCRLLAEIAMVEENLDDADALLLRALGTATAAHSEYTRGLVLLDMANVTYGREDIGGAIATYYRALEIFETIGHLGGLEFTGTVLPGFLRRQGMKSEAVASCVGC